MEEPHAFLDRFYISRIGIRVLIGQYLSLRQQPVHNYIGIICQKNISLRNRQARHRRCFLHVQSQVWRCSGGYYYRTSRFDLSLCAYAFALYYARALEKFHARHR
mmetsp:Transcript_10925/g.16139  ORF Transcript_10925/g.16139 Transcript_10925/m.16139 type:complete len:105 (-) Transcript_10925:392-706(-)